MYFGGIGSFLNSHARVLSWTVVIKCGLILGLIHAWITVASTRSSKFVLTDVWTKCASNKQRQHGVTYALDQAVHICRVPRLPKSTSMTTQKALSI